MIDRSSHQSGPAIPPEPPSFWGSLRFWLKLGFISFGGPAGQIAIMHEELVIRRRWLSEQRFLHALNYCMLLPGPEAQQLATYLGWLLHRTWGSILAGTLFILPGMLLILLLSWLYVVLGHNPIVAGLLSGIKPAVAVIVLHAAYRIGTRTLRRPLLWGIALAAFLAIAVLQLPFPAILLLAASVGWAVNQLCPDAITVTQHLQASSTREDALIGDQTVLPHTQFSRGKLARVLGYGALLWLLPVAAIQLIPGETYVLEQISWFFTKAALFTFGGAYAVLPYVFQGSVEQFNWLSTAQMMDGLALGETTPGPLILIVTYIGFIAGYSQGCCGMDQPLLSGLLAALTVTWFTFLPSFIFILAGGPLIESTQQYFGLSAPLTAITAAVVGVILNLALFLSYHVFLPAGMNGNLSLSAILIAVMAGLALFRYKMSVLKAIAGSGLLGCLLIN